MRRCAILFACLMAALFAPPAAAQLAVGQHLEAAGFVMRPADTPQKMAILKKLPPHRFIARSNAGRRYYVYADASYCRCAFVGDEKALQAYRDIAAARLPQVPDLPPSGVSPVHEMIRDIDADIGVPDDDLFISFGIPF
jgi:hypothetical protein